MSAEDQAKVKSTKGTKTHKFGAGESVRSLRKVGFHAYVVGNKVNFLVDIIPGDLPFLISLKTMRERGFIIDCERDTVSIRMKTGLVIAPVRGGDNGHHYWLALEHEGKGRIKSCLTKILGNFGHPKNWRLKELLVGGGKWHKDMEDIIERISKECQADVRVLPRKRPLKPIVALPRATKFNEVVTLDLVISMKEKPILFMIDWHSRLTIGTVIPNKKCESVVKAIIKWVGVTVGVPGCLF
jgi:hypothetical protein